MNTNEQFVSRVAGAFKALTKDGRMSRRQILSVGRDKARFLMSQKLDEMTLFKEDGIISTVPCIELEEVPLIECDLVDIPNCNSVMRSTEKLPEGLFGKNGSGVIYVFSVDNSQKFDYTNPRRYRDVKRMRYVRDLSKYYMIINGYLYLPNSEVELVSLQMIVLDKSQIPSVSSCAEQEEKCKSQWKFEFVCPDRFYDLVVRDTLAELANIYRTSVEDSNPNLDPNQKGKTVQ